MELTFTLIWHCLVHVRVYSYSKTNVPLPQNYYTQLIVYGMHVGSRAYAKFHPIVTPMYRYTIVCTTVEVGRFC